MITAAWLQNNERRSLCNCIDNLVKFCEINTFCTRKLQSLWSTVYLSLLWTKSKFILTFVFPFKSFFVCFISQFTYRLLHPYCDSLVYLAISFLEIIPKTIRNCIIAFFDWLLIKHETCNIQNRYDCYMPWVLKKTGSLGLTVWIEKNVTGIVQ